MKKIAILFAVLVLAGCSGSHSDGPSIVIPGEPADGIVAKLNGAPITEADIQQQVGSQLVRLHSQLYEIKKNGIDQVITERLIKAEAEKQGLSVEALLKKEVDDKVGTFTQEEKKAFYEKNKARYKDKSYQEMEVLIDRILSAQTAARYQNNFVDRLKDKADYTILLSRPKINVGIDDDPMAGDKDAVVTIIEFTDYQCPFCARARPTFKQVLDEYKGKVRWVLRDFPLDFHPQSKKASEAATCAGDQEKYWEYSNHLWQNQRNIDIPSLKKYAKELGLDSKKFDKCLDSNKYSEEVEKDLADGKMAGVSGTPSFFINGQMLTGARPIEQFREVIDEELRAANKKSTEQKN